VVIIKNLQILVNSDSPNREAGQIEIDAKADKFEGAQSGDFIKTRFKSSVTQKLNPMHGNFFFERWTEACQPTIKRCQQKRREKSPKLTQSELPSTSCQWTRYVI